MAYATLAQLRQYLGTQIADLGVQRVTVTDATGGTFTLSYEGSTTAALAYNATATTVQAALQAIGAIGSNVKVTGRPGDYLVTFSGTLATDAGPLSADGALLTGVGAAVAVDSALDQVLQDALDRATDIVRVTLQALLADPLFDYAAYGAASTKIVRGYQTTDLRIPAHNAGSVSLVEIESGSNPLTYTEIDAGEYSEEAYYLYRPAGWSPSSRYRVTAAWGYGATVPASIEEVTLQVAVNIFRSRDTGGYIEAAGPDGAGSTLLVAGLTKIQRSTLQAHANLLIDFGV